MGGADSIEAPLSARGISRRSCLKFSSAMAATLSLPPVYGPRIAQALATAPHVPVV